MAPADALDHLRTRLETSFGKALAVFILASCSNAANVTAFAIDADQFLRLADEVGRDQRVIDMWGAAGAAEAAAQWKALL